MRQDSRPGFIIFTGCKHSTPCDGVNDHRPECPRSDRSRLLRRLAGTDCADCEFVRYALEMGYIPEARRRKKRKPNDTLTLRGGPKGTDA